ncbi:MAG: hypothetical protein ACRDNK_24520 [Solirubrobacteraceae bacterium]
MSSVYDLSVDVDRRRRRTRHCVGDDCGQAERPLGHGVGGAQGEPGAPGAKAYGKGYE